MLLTTGMQLDTVARQREFVAQLADHQLAGVGFGIGFGHDAVPGPLIEAAVEREFAVFEIPYELPFIAVTESAFSQLVNEQYAVLRRALAAQERLERIVLSQRGLDAVAGALATSIGAAVLVFDPRGELLVQHAFRRTTDPQTLERVRHELRDCDAILGPIEASEGHYGGELMRSLEAFIEENGQWERAARRLYCHRHTLRYRIRRVEELTGRNLASARADRVLAGPARP